MSRTVVSLLLYSITYYYALKIDVLRNTSLPVRLHHANHDVKIPSWNSLKIWPFVLILQSAALQCLSLLVIGMVLSLTAVMDIHPSMTPSPNKLSPTNFIQDRQEPTQHSTHPSTKYSPPVMYDAASDKSNMACPVISCGSANRPSGTLLA